MLDLTTIDDHLDALKSSLPRMLQDYPEQADFMNAFAGETEVVEELAGLHAEHVYARISEMLQDVGLITRRSEDHGD